MTNTAKNSNYYWCPREGSERDSSKAFLKRGYNRSRKLAKHNQSKSILRGRQSCTG